MNKTKLLILLTVFIDIIGLGIVIPILPYYVSSFSASPLLITSLFAVYSLCSFFSSPLIGALSDRFGRKPLLLISLFSTAIGWFIFAGASNIFLLFLGRIVDGIAAGNLPIAQSYLSDIAKDSKERAANLGLIGAVFGIGFIFGPFLGGALGHFGHTVPFWIVGFLALFNTILAIFILPETHTQLSTKKISFNPFAPLFGAFNDTVLRSNYFAWFLFGMAAASFQSIFALYLRDVFHFTEIVGGFIFGGAGIIIAFNQAVAMRHFWLKHFKEPTLELGMLALSALGFLLSGVNIFFVFCLALVLTTFGNSVLRVVMMSQVVGESDPSRRGEVLGVMTSIASLSMVISPLISGVLYEKSYSLPFIISSIYMFVAFIILYQKRKKLARINLPEDVVVESTI